MKTVIVIPARWQSTRLPGKPLMHIGNKTMIQHTWEKAKESLADDVIIATDDQKIFKTAIFLVYITCTCLWASHTHKATLIFLISDETSLRSEYT